MNTFENMLLMIKQNVLFNDELAEILNVDYSKWKTHIFYGTSQAFSTGMNRGRLPFIRFELLQDDFVDETVNGGKESFRFVIRLCLGKNDVEKASILIQTFARKIFTLLQEVEMCEQTPNYSIAELQSLPWGFQCDITIPVEISYSNDTFGDNEE